jgi:Bacterial aa3 type cytochrome c oxidase subunit IV
MTVDTSDGNENMDYAQHEQTYELFTGLVKWGTVSVVIILILMAIFLL